MPRAWPHGQAPAFTDGVRPAQEGIAGTWHTAVRGWCHEKE